MIVMPTAVHVQGMWTCGCYGDSLFLWIAVIRYEEGTETALTPPCSNSLTFFVLVSTSFWLLASILALLPLKQNGNAGLLTNVYSAKTELIKLFIAA